MADHRFVTSLKSVRKRHQQLNVCDAIGLFALCFCHNGRKKSTNRVFPLFLRCKLCLHPLQDPINTLSCSKFTLNHWLKFSIVPKSDLRSIVPKPDLRCKVHKKCEKNNPP